MPMTPALRQWLTAYHEAMDEHDGWERDWNPARLPTPRPLAAQFTITADCDLLDAHGRLIANIADLDPATLNLGRTPMPRAATRNRHIEPARFLRDGRAVFDGDALPDGCQPGDVVLHNGQPVGIIGLNAANRVTIMTPERHGISVSELTRVRDAAATPLSRITAALQEVDDTAIQCADVSGIPEGTAAECDCSGDALGGHRGDCPARVYWDAATGTIRDAPLMPEEVRNLWPHMTPAAREQALAENPGWTAPAEPGTSMHETLERMGVDLTGVEPGAIQRIDPTPAPPEVHEGPTMLANTAHGFTGLFRRHTGTDGEALDRARAVWGTYASPRQFVNRAHGGTPTEETVRHNTRPLTLLLRRGYGIEVDDTVARALSAITTTIAREAARPLIDRAEQAEERLSDVRGTLARVRQERAELRQRLTTQPVPGQAVRDAVDAAKAWKETGISDSVAKRDSFLRLLDTLERLAQ